jgi:hypothetical protein
MKYEKPIANASTVNISKTFVIGGCSKYRVLRSR